MSPGRLRATCTDDSSARHCGVCTSARGRQRRPGVAQATTPTGPSHIVPAAEESLKEERRAISLAEDETLRVGLRCQRSPLLTISSSQQQQQLMMMLLLLAVGALPLSKSVTFFLGSDFIVMETPRRQEER
ncbi:unnamed protein product [Lampetra planeri]